MNSRLGETRRHDSQKACNVKVKQSQYRDECVKRRDAFRRVQVSRKNRGRFMMCIVGQQSAVGQQLVRSLPRIRTEPVDSLC